MAGSPSGSGLNEDPTPLRSNWRLASSEWLAAGHFERGGCAPIREPVTNVSRGHSLRWGWSGGWDLPLQPAGRPAGRPAQRSAG